MKHTPVLLTAPTLGSIVVGIALLATAPVQAQTETPTHSQQPPAAGIPSQSEKHTAPRRTANRADDYQTALNNRIAQMHRTLKITASQEAAWSAFAQVMHDNANTVADAYKQRSSTIDTMNASQNLQNYVQIEEQRAQGVQKLSIAFDTLYGQLSDEQKQAADQMFRQYQLTARGAHRPDAAAPAATQKAPAAKSP